MGIDLFTFAAQVVNFIVLLFLLKKFLFKRITAAMDEREQRIAASIETAKENERATAAEAEAARAIRREIEQKRIADAAALEAEIQALRMRLENEARALVERERDRWFEQLTNEEKSLTEEIAKRSGDIMLLLLRKALADLADETLEDRMISLFMKKMAAQKAGWFVPGAAYTVSSTFELSEVQKSRLKELSEALGGKTASVSFIQKPDTLCGIELRGGGGRLSWNLDEYIDKLKESISFPEKAKS